MLWTHESDEVSDSWKQPSADGGLYKDLLTYTHLNQKKCLCALLLDTFRILLG